MRLQRPLGFGTVVALAVVLAVVGGVWRAQAQGNGASTVLRGRMPRENANRMSSIDGSARSMRSISVSVSPFWCSSTAG